MKRAFLFTAVGAVFAVAFTMHSQPSRGGGEPGGPRSFISSFPVTIALDTNKDGVISAGEIDAAASSLKKADKNGDGKISADELRPNSGGRGGRSSSKGRRGRRSNKW